MQQMSTIQTAIIRDGVLYKVENEDETNNFEISISDSIEPQETCQISAELKELTSWDHTSTKLFLDECIKRKHVLRNPCRSRRSIFAELRLEMLGKGYNFDDLSLDRKFRNLKTRYLFIKRNNKKNPKSHRISWRYFHQMNEIFADTKSRPSNQIMASLRDSETETETELRQYPAHSEKSRGGRYNLNDLRNELLIFEERRTIAIESIAEQLKETNRLTREKLAFEKRKLENTYVAKVQNGEATF